MNAPISCLVLDRRRDLGREFFGTFLMVKQNATQQFLRPASGCTPMLPHYPAARVRLTDAILLYEPLHAPALRFRDVVLLAAAMVGITMFRRRTRSPMRLGRFATTL